MKKLELFFIIISACSTAWVLNDFLVECGMVVDFFLAVILCLSISTAFLAFFWFGRQLSKKAVFIFQATKHLIVGVLATVIDLKLFEFLLFSFPIMPILAKSISFIIAVVAKYRGNKYWAFEKTETDNHFKEFSQFFILTAAGLILDVGIFYFLTEITGPQLAISESIWLKLSVLAAAVVSAVWNFSAYKFLVFKK